MPCWRVSATVECYGAAMSACGKASEWPKALQILQEMEGKQLEMGAVCYNTALLACGASSRWQEMLKIMEDFY